MALITTKQAAQLLGVSPSYVKALINMHRLPAQKPGHDFLIDQKDVMSLKKSLQKKRDAKGK